jgi:hypothetical protein
VGAAGAFLDPFWLRGGEIFGFSDVVFQIIQLIAVGSFFAFMENPEELPITRRDGYGWRWAVGNFTGAVGEEGEDGFTCKWLSSKDRGDADAVEMLRCLRLQSEQFKEGRIEIRDLNRRVAATGRRG